MNSDFKYINLIPTHPLHLLRKAHLISYLWSFVLESCALLPVSSNLAGHVKAQPSHPSCKLVQFSSLHSKYTENNMVLFLNQSSQPLSIIVLLGFTSSNMQQNDLQVSLKAC